MTLFFKKTLKYVLAIIGSIILLNGIALFFVSNINLGNFLTVALGVCILFITLFFEKLNKILKSFIVSAICLAIIFSSFLIFYGKSDNATYKEDAVIVLGAAVHGDKLSLTLKRRLDVAIEYHKKNPTAIIVVSGGKGQGESVTEASAMETYLLKNGVPQPCILKENSATSTYENFMFSKEIIKENFGKDADIAYITNEYHIMRAGLCAKKSGIESITHLHSDTNNSYLISGVLRECLAVIKYAVLKR